jgi:hypothetical protein
VRGSTLQSRPHDRRNRPCQKVQHSIHEIHVKIPRVGAFSVWMRNSQCAHDKETKRQTLSSPYTTQLSALRVAGQAVRTKIKAAGPTTMQHCAGLIFRVSMSAELESLTNANLNHNPQITCSCSKLHRQLTSSFRVVDFYARRAGVRASHRASYM